MAATDPAPQDVVVDLTPIGGVIDTLNEIRLAKAKLEDREKELLELVKSRLGSQGTVGQINGVTVVTWREAPRTTFDQKAFRADVGDAAADKYTKTTPVRSFRYTGGAK